MENANWANAFGKVFHKIEQINHTTYNHSTFSREIMGGAVNRNTIGNWLKGSTMPGHREDVIKLGVTAGYGESEMNELLLAAGKRSFTYGNLIKLLFLYFGTPTTCILQNRMMISAVKQ